MTVTYSNGDVVEGVVLSQQNGSIRVAVQGSDDVAEFKRVNGSWVSGDGETVHLEFAWEHSAGRDIPAEVDCLSPEELSSVRAMAPCAATWKIPWVN